MASNVAQPLERQFSLIAVRPEPQHRFRGGGRAGGHQRRHRAVAGEPAEPADVSQGQPRRCAHHGDGGAVRHAAADPGERFRRQHPGPADLADFRRGAGEHRWPAKTRGADPGGSGQAVSPGPEPGRHPGRDRHHHGQPAQGHPRRRAPELHHLYQRPVAVGRAVERHGAGLPQRRADPGA
ncbi:hypothetical protein G6F31_017352 [Rhizopus arrhizus]|nr:hypothetical protein G6F31_017352 [Rhizopus arrhizus]